MFWHLSICLGCGVVVLLACYVVYSVYFFTHLWGVVGFPLSPIFPQITCYIWDSSKICFVIIYCNTQYKLGTEKLFYFCCLCWQEPKPRLCYLLLDEWSLSNIYSSRIWALGNCKVESLWHGIESGMIHVFISLMFLGFPVEGGLGREWMMAA